MIGKIIILNNFLKIIFKRML